MTRFDGEQYTGTKESFLSRSPLQRAIVEGPKGQAVRITNRDRFSGITSGVNNAGASVGTRAEETFANITARARNTTQKQRLIAASCLIGVVMISAISSSVGGGNSGSSSDNNGGGGGGGDGGDGGGDGGDGGFGDGKPVDIEGLSKFFTTNVRVGFGDMTGNNSTVNGTENGGAGYLQRCNPGYGYGCLDAPECAEGLVCVTDSHFSSWCMTCDMESDEYKLQCALVNPHAITSLNIQCSHTNPEGCDIESYAGRDERCNPGDETSKFSNFRSCVPGLKCVASNDNSYTQCVVCQDPFWSEDCVWWKPDFRDAAKSMCGNTECKHKKKAGRDDRCSPQPEHEDFGQFPMCATGLRCATTKYFSQCVSCEAANYLVDCTFWVDDFKAAAALICEGAPECGSQPNLPAETDGRCRRFPEDLQFYNYPECASGDVCVSTGCYSQCVRCNNWEIDCKYWAPLFLEAAEDACGFEGKGCNPAAFCTDGTTPDEHGVCKLVGNSEACVSDSETETEAGESPEAPMCRHDLKCVTSGQTSQCVDCSEQFLYDCPYWEAGFLEAAEARCQRECVPLTNPPGPCSSDDECGSPMEGWACVTTCEYSQCVQCFGDQFSWDCGYWEGAFLEAAVLRCGRNCEPEVCPHPRTTAPTMTLPSPAPTFTPTAFPTRQNGDTDNICYQRRFDETCEGPAALINSANQGIEARFLIASEDECEVFCSANSGCAAFTYIESGVAGSGGSYIINGVNTTPVGSGACYFISEISNILTQIGHRCYAKTLSGGQSCTTKAPSIPNPTRAPSKAICYERSFDEYCNGEAAFINLQNTGFQRNFLIASEDECEVFCLANSACAGFSYYQPGFPLSGGFTTGAGGRQTNLVGTGACYFHTTIDGATAQEGSRCYVHVPTYDDGACATKAPSTMTPSKWPTRWPTTSPSKSPTKTPTGTLPTTFPTKMPSSQPSKFPTVTPTTNFPTRVPSNTPSKSPTTKFPTQYPTSLPSVTPSKAPSVSPTSLPSVTPSKEPSVSPSKAPTVKPTRVPSNTPSKSPTTKSPTRMPTYKPTIKILFP